MSDLATLCIGPFFYFSVESSSSTFVHELRAHNMKFININKIVMIIIKHARVVSRLPKFVQQNINARVSLKFQRVTRYK